MNASLEREFGNRLTTLRDGRRGLRGGITCDVREPSAAISGDEPKLDFIASDETLDRYNEVILADGWELENYLRNPVVVDSHDYSSVTKILGISTAVAVLGGKLVNRVKFALDNPLGKMTYHMARGGFIRSESVGFVPIHWTNGSGNGKDPSRTYTRSELLEISLVAIPANPSATVGLALKEGAIDRSDIRDVREMLTYLSDLETPCSRAWRRSYPWNEAPAPLKAVDRLLERLNKISRCL